MKEARDRRRRRRRRWVENTASRSRCSSRNRNLPVLRHTSPGRARSNESRRSHREHAAFAHHGELAFISRTRSGVETALSRRCVRSKRRPAGIRCNPAFSFDGDWIAWVQPRRLRRWSLAAAAAAGSSGSPEATAAVPPGGGSRTRRSSVGARTLTCSRSRRADFQPFPTARKQRSGWLLLRAGSRASPRAQCQRRGSGRRMVAESR